MNTYVEEQPYPPFDTVNRITDIKLNFKVGNIFK